MTIVRDDGCPADHCFYTSCRPSGLGGFSKLFLHPPIKNNEKYAKKPIVVNLFDFFEILKFHFFSFFLEMLSPERFKQLREACRMHFHLVAPLKTVMVPSYDQKTKKIND